MKIIDRDGARYKPESSGVRGGPRSLLKHQNSQAAFTMVELLMVMAILGVMVMLAVPLYSKMVMNVKVSRAISEIRAIEKGILASAAENQSYPASLNAINLDSWRDPWDQPYQYLNIENGGAPRQSEFFEDLNTDFDIYSLGPDGVTTQLVSDADGKDDVVRAADGSWLGIGGEF